MNHKAPLTAGVLAAVALALAASIVYVANPGLSPDTGQELSSTAKSAGDTSTAIVTATHRSPEREPTNVVTPAPAAADPTPAALPILARGSTSFFQIAVREIQYAQEFASHQTDQTFCIIPLTATNIGSQDKILVLSDFYLLDTENHRYSTIHSEGMARRIPPGKSELGTLVFELPSGASPRELVLSDSSHAAQVLLRLNLAP